MQEFNQLVSGDAEDGGKGVDINDLRRYMHALAWCYFYTLTLDERPVHFSCVFAWVRTNNGIS